VQHRFRLVGAIPFGVWAAACLTVLAPRQSSQAAPLGEKTVTGTVGDDGTVRATPTARAAPAPHTGSGTN